MTFEQAIKIVLELEGGYHHDVRDPGGETNFGITKKWFPHLDIKNLTRGEAMEIYRKEYWTPLSLEHFPESLRLMIFDCAVNQGLSKAKEFACTAFGVSKYFKLDESFFSTYPQNEVLPALVRFAQLRLNAYVATRNFQTFGKGWLSRLLFVALRTGNRAGES
jgi:lysozyme family protein